MEGFDDDLEGEAIQNIVTLYRKGFYFPSGTILLWNKTLGDIPTGWKEIGTTLGSGRLIKGRGTEEKIGGREKIKIGINEMPPHTHSVVEKNIWNNRYSGDGGGGTEFLHITDGIGTVAKRDFEGCYHTHDIKSEGGGKDISIMPEYVTLCLIMKI